MNFVLLRNSLRSYLQCMKCNALQIPAEKQNTESGAGSQDSSMLSVVTISQR